MNPWSVVLNFLNGLKSSPAPSSPSPPLAKSARATPGLSAGGIVPAGQDILPTILHLPRPGETVLSQAQMEVMKAKVAEAVASKTSPPSTATVPPPAARGRLERVRIALLDYGLTELAGASTAPEILAMATETGAAYKGDETAWCGLAMAAWVTRAGGTPPKGFLSARTWLTWGEAVDSAPEPGDICVLWRGDPQGWEGHVGLFIAKRGRLLYLLGGNQGNTVTIASHLADRVLGFRRG